MSVQWWQYVGRWKVFLQKKCPCTPSQSTPGRFSSSAAARSPSPAAAAILVSSRRDTGAAELASQQQRRPDGTLTWLSRPLTTHASTYADNASLPRTTDRRTAVAETRLSRRRPSQIDDAPTTPTTSSGSAGSAEMRRMHAGVRSLRCVSWLPPRLLRLLLLLLAAARPPRAASRRAVCRSHLCECRTEVLAASTALKIDFYNTMCPVLTCIWQ